MASTIEEQLFKDFEKSLNENNTTFLEYQTKHNKLLEVYNNNIKFLTLKKTQGDITIVNWCSYIKKIQEEIMIELSNIHASITPLIKQQIYQKQMCESFNNDKETETENDLLYEKNQFSEQLVGVTGGCYYNM